MENVTELRTARPVQKTALASTAETEFAWQVMERLATVAHLTAVNARRSQFAEILFVHANTRLV
jgi:hypothetical protein